LAALMTDLEADPPVKVVVFQSANPDFFIAHLDQGGYLGCRRIPCGIRHRSVTGW